MSEFKREDRYIIIKRSDLKKVPVAYRSALVDPMFSLLSHLPRRECVVVEHDWPEYHLVWAMIEHRMAGKPVPDFNLWRRADALQALLTAADERVDERTAHLLECGTRRKALELRVGDLEDLLRDINDAPGGSQFKKHIDAALKPAEGQLNQCDGCQAGIPVVNGAHRMGKPGVYPDTMSCTAKLYKP